MSIHIAISPQETITITAVSAASIRWHVGPVELKETTVMPIEVTLTNEEKVRLTVTPMTPGGEPAPIDGEAQWSIEGTCTTEVIDATSAWVISGTEIGDSVLTVACDADLGSGVVPLADTAVIHVHNPMAANLGLAADTPQLKNPAA
jgi:hypothetical protein